MKELSHGYRKVHNLTIRTESNQDQKNLKQTGPHIILKGNITNSALTTFTLLFLNLYTIINWAFLCTPVSSSRKYEK